MKGFERNSRQALFSWLFVGVLSALIITLGALQYRWIDEVSRAEGVKLRSSLQASLYRLSQEFNAEITAACAALLPRSLTLEEGEVEEAYAIRYALWKDSSLHDGLFRRISIAVPQGNSLLLRDLDLDREVFRTEDWPPGWSTLRERLTAGLSQDPAPFRRPFGPFSEAIPELIALPRLGPPAEGDPFPWRGRPAVLEWLILELDLDYLRAVVFPELLQRHLGGAGDLDYQAEVVSRDNPSTVVYRAESDPAERIGSRPDASVGLLEVQWEQIVRPRVPIRAVNLRETWLSRGGGSPGNAPPARVTNADRGRWELLVRHRAGSLEAAVSRARRRNIGVTTAILLLMVAAIAALVRFTREAQRLAGMQMEFVAGVSHELRTPLSVIHTAAYNLRGGVVNNLEQAQRYGALIQEEGAKVTAMVEQVLGFARSATGYVVRTRNRLSVEALVQDAVDSIGGLLQESGCAVETEIQPGLPSILGDPVALKHALQNLLSNAARHGREGKWIGIFASMAKKRKETLVEIRIADHGPGIPPNEAGQVFDPFFRGKRALESQIHGAGLGLSLVKRIVEAYAGTVIARSGPGKGAEFVIRIPAAPPEQENAFTNTADRG